MKTIILYYSYSGNTKKIAEKLASELSADIEEIREVKRLNKINAYSIGCFDAIRGKEHEILPLEKDLNSYEHIIILAPVWADNPAPATNAVWSKLPSGKKVSIKMVSASGKSGCQERISKILTERGCELISFENVKA